MQGLERIRLCEFIMGQLRLYTSLDRILGMWVIGSMARGEQGPVDTGSDIDIWIDTSMNVFKAAEIQRILWDSGVTWRGRRLDIQMKGKPPPKKWPKIELWSLLD